MTRSPELWEAIRRVLRTDQWTSLKKIYNFVERDLQLDGEDFMPQSATSPIPKWKRNVGNVLQWRKETGKVQWDRHTHYKL